MIAYLCFIGALDNVYVFNYRRGKYVPIFNLIAQCMLGNFQYCIPDFMMSG